MSGVQGSPPKVAKTKAGTRSISEWYPVVAGPIPPPPPPAPKKRAQRQKGLPPSRRSVRGIAEVDATGIVDERKLLAGDRALLTAEEKQKEKDDHFARMRGLRLPKVVHTNEYKMRLGWNPFPQYVKPTAQQCNQVLQILRKDIKNKNIDMKDKGDPSQASGADGPAHATIGASVNSIVVTILSQATNNDLALIQENLLKEAFPYFVKGDRKVGKTPNYHAMRIASHADIEAAISYGGLGAQKSVKIKQVLEIVYGENVKRRTATQLPILDDPVDVMEFVPSMLALDFLSEMAPQETLDWLLKLPGVGVKTAYCILQFNLNIPAYAVDTHVMQMSNLLGWLPPWASKDMNKACIHLDARVPDEMKYELHQLKWHHRQNCRACGTVKKGGPDLPCPLLAKKLISINRKPKLVRPSLSTKILEGDDEKTVQLKQKRKAKNDLEREKKRQNTVLPPFVRFGKMSEQEAKENGYLIRKISISDGFGEDRQNITGALYGWYLSTDDQAMDTTEPVTVAEAAAAEARIAPKTPKARKTKAGPGSQQQAAFRNFFAPLDPDGKAAVASTRPVQLATFQSCLTPLDGAEKVAVAGIRPVQQATAESDLALGNGAEETAVGETEFLQQNAAEPDISPEKAAFGDSDSTLNEAEGESTAVSDESDSPVPNAPNDFVITYTYRTELSADSEDAVIVDKDEEAEYEGYTGYDEEDYSGYDVEDYAGDDFDAGDDEYAETGFDSYEGHSAEMGYE